MTIGLLDAVMAIEKASYAAPWTRGNFIDSLAAGHIAQCLFDTRAGLVGYCVAMPGAGELHLLNLTVTPSQTAARPRSAHARCTDSNLPRRRHDRNSGSKCASATNAPAQLYRALRPGRRLVCARPITRRPLQAPAAQREDAVVMRLTLGTKPCDALDAATT